MPTAHEHLIELARMPRPAGSLEEANARTYCSIILSDVGFDTRHRPFRYSTFPGRWGTPIAGTLAVALFLYAGVLGASEAPRAALELLLAGAALLGLFAWALGRWGVLDFPFARLRGNNLIATRGEPTIWLVAHLDSKSQPISIAVRATSIIALIVLWVVAVAVAIAQLRGLVPPWLWFPLSSIGALAAVPVAGSVVGARSAGALDNASGVATVLRVAELLPRDGALGVLLTSGEELGLVGARAWAREAKPAMAINVDGIDDTGDLRLIYSGRRPSPLIALLGSAWPAPRRLVPGVLMDGVALSDAGWAVVNVSKGSWRTVRRIHTPSDDLAHLEGSGAEELAVMLAGAIEASRH